MKDSCKGKNANANVKKKKKTYSRQCGQGPLRATELVRRSHSAGVVHMALGHIVQGEVLHGDSVGLVSATSA